MAGKNDGPLQNQRFHHTPRNVVATVCCCKHATWEQQNRDRLWRFGKMCRALQKQHRVPKLRLPKTFANGLALISAKRHPDTIARQGS
jgi:hypothetical protein